MARLRDRTAAGWRYAPQGHDGLDIILNLLLAPTGEYSEDQLRIAWEVERDRLMEHDRNNPATFATRPWAYWKFELGEEHAMTARRSRIRFVRRFGWPSLATFSRMKWRH